ncbi:MAG: 3-isopropylmalate dehydrogenase [Bacteroidota bacterium]
MATLRKIAILPGDGIGPEVMSQGIKALKAIEEKYNHKFELKEALMGGIAIDRTGQPLPDETLEISLEADAVLLGAIGTPKYADPTMKVRPEQGLLGLRKALGLYANIRPVKAYDKLVGLSPIKNDRIKGADFVIYRELTGGVYFGISGRNEDNSMAYDTMSYESYEIERIAHAAFKTAMNREQRLCLVDKANVLESSRFWRETVDQVAMDYPSVKLSYLYIDNAAMQMILNPTRFDVVLTANLFGDILSDEASVIGGSLGLLPSASIGDERCLFEPVHGSYPEGAGKDIANPTAMILSVAMMFEHFDLHQEAQDIYRAIETCMDKSIMTSDLNPDVSYSCSQFGDIIEAIIMGEEINLKSVRQGSASII